MHDNFPVLFRTNLTWEFSVEFLYDWSLCMIAAHVWTGQSCRVARTYKSACRSIWRHMAL
jgi:hypothetical protein